MFPGACSEVFGGAIKEIANTVVRKILNEAFENPAVTVDNLVVAIREDRSLWGEGKGEIKKYASRIPSFAIPLASQYLEGVEQEYGGMANLALMWLQQDQPQFYSVILNTPGGEDWHEHQVEDILIGLGIRKDN